MFSTRPYKSLSPVLTSVNSKAFVEFLEQESVPHSPVVLPVVEMAKSKQVF